MSLPVRVLIGYLPDITRKDAEHYVKGAAQSNFDSISNAYWHVEPYAQGFAYEAHEGGGRLAYLPSILRILQESEDPVFIKTATRTVQVEKSTQGLSAVWLPEAEIHETTEGVVPSSKMKLVTPDAREWVYAGGMFFLAGVVALALGLASSLVAATAYRDAQAVGIHTYVPKYPLPYTKWEDLTNSANQGDTVTMLKFENGHWLPIQTASMMHNLAPAMADMQVVTPHSGVLPPVGSPRIPGHPMVPPGVPVRPGSLVHPGIPHPATAHPIPGGNKP
jgi:hypothetical protein